MAEEATLELARRLISRRSITPDDAGCLDLIAAPLAACGFRIERMDRGAVSNLWARHGTGRPVVCFAGHTDVVPPGALADWDTDPFVPALREGELIGRGAADMKSSLAAFVGAATRYVRQRPSHDGSIAVLLTSDEEGDAVEGTVRVVEALRARNEAIDYCIVGEPTSAQRLGDTIKNGRRGSLGGILVVKGIQGHVAYPQLARNPIHAAAPALAELAAMVWDQGDGDFPPTTFQISNIRAGTGATNVIPGELEVVFNFRFSPASPAEQLKARFTAVLDRHPVRFELEWSLSAKPYLTPAGVLVAVVQEAIKAETGREAELSTNGGTSDGRFIAEICPEVIEFGPLNATIHKVNERIAVADLARLSRIYEHALTQLLGP